MSRTLSKPHTPSTAEAKKATIDRMNLVPSKYPSRPMMPLCNTHGTYCQEGATPFSRHTSTTRIYVCMLDFNCTLQSYLFIYFLINNDWCILSVVKREGLKDIFVSTKHKISLVSQNQSTSIRKSSYRDLSTTGAIPMTP